MRRSPVLVEALERAVLTELASRPGQTRAELCVSPDLALDVIVRNTGRVDAALLALEARIYDWSISPHGLPGEGLLLPQITYAVTLNHGRPGTYRSQCEPPLLVKNRSMATRTRGASTRSAP